jgi:hypothetical protein
MSAFTNDQVNVIREWFDTVHDVVPDSLTDADFKLAGVIYEYLPPSGFRMPAAVTDRLSPLR